MNEKWKKRATRRLNYFAKVRHKSTRISAPGKWFYRANASVERRDFPFLSSWKFYFSLFNIDCNWTQISSSSSFSSSTVNPLPRDVELPDWTTCLPIIFYLTTQKRVRRRILNSSKSSTRTILLPISFLRTECLITDISTWSADILNEERGRGRRRDFPSKEEFNKNFRLSVAWDFIGSSWG